MVFLVLSGAVWGAGEALAQLPPPLSAVPVPRPSNLSDFIRDEGAARILGKALFWDMQVGSDGVQACASCHFHAGADSRKKNQVSPGLLRVLFGNPAVLPDPDLDFDGQGPNYTLRGKTSPSGGWLIHAIASRPSSRTPTTSCRRRSALRDLRRARLLGLDPEGFYVGRDRRRANVRRVEPRNTPTMINAVFNHGTSGTCGPRTCSTA